MWTLLVIIIVKCLLPSNASGEHIYVHAHAIGWHLFAPSHYCLIFHLCICKFLSSPWIRQHRHWKNGFDYYIQQFTPQPYPMHQFTNPSPSHLPLSSSSQMYTRLYFANSRKQRQGNTQGIWQEQCTIYCTAMLLKVLALVALNSICWITCGKLLLTDSWI